ncbi:hypothetical protein [Hydrogenobaculum acidophilum]
MFTRNGESVGYPVATYVVKTKKTLKKLLQSAKENNLVVLYLPNPVRIPKGFWQAYKGAKTRFEKNDVIKTHGLLKDNRIFALERIVIDIDSGFEVAYQAWSYLGIPADIYITKSNRFRAIINIKPRFFDKKVIYPSLDKVNKFNGKTNEEMLREMIKIFSKFFELYGLNFDRTFFRVNHPIILENQQIGAGYRLVQGATEQIDFFELYRKLKKLNIELKDKEQRKEDEQNKKKEHPVKIPPFMKDKLINLEELYSLAVKTLAQKHSNYRFTRVMLPAVGWAKYLNLDESFVYNLLRECLPDKTNFDEDFAKAWKYAREIEFIAEDISYLSQTYESYSNRVLELLSYGPLTRQQLLQDVFNNQKWLCDAVMNFLNKIGAVYFVNKPKEGKGRPEKIFFLSKKKKRANKSKTDNQNPKSQLIYKLRKRKDRKSKKVKNRKLRFFIIIVVLPENILYEKRPVKIYILISRFIK